MFKVFKAWMLAATLFGTSAFADSALPQQMTVVYDLYRNGQKLGSVTDHFERHGSQYQLVSEARATGPLKFLWPTKIRLESSGEITAQGLRPQRFVHDRSDQPSKTAMANLDWIAHRVEYHYKGETFHDDSLREGAQDQLSQFYQFAFLPDLPSRLDLQVVSGRKLADYRYVRHDGGSVKVPDGTFATQVFERIMDADAEKAISVWIAPAYYHLPVRIRVIENGVTMEQRLVHLTLKT